MTDRGDVAIPDAIYDAASDWSARVERREPGVEQKLADWLAADPRHARAYAFTTGFLAESSRLSRSALRSDGSLKPAPFYRRQSTHRALAIAATVSLAVALPTWLAIKEDLSPFSSQARAAAFETNVGEIREVTLQNGIALILDTSTKIVVTPGTEPIGIELVRGRYRTRVKGGARAFQVVSGSARLALEGSSFDVMRSGEGARIVAINAPVRFERPQTGQAPVLDAGSQVLLGRDDMAIPYIRSDTGWVGGVLALDATRLDTAIAAINRYNTLKIRLEDSSVAGRTLTGGYRAVDPVGFAGAVGKVFHLDVTRDGQTLRLRAATD